MIGGSSFSFAVYSNTGIALANGFFLGHCFTLLEHT